MKKTDMTALASRPPSQRRTLYLAFWLDGETLVPAEYARRLDIPDAGDCESALSQAALEGLMRVASIRRQLAYGASPSLLSASFVQAVRDDDAFFALGEAVCVHDNGLLLAQGGPPTARYYSRRFDDPAQLQSRLARNRLLLAILRDDQGYYESLPDASVIPEWPGFNKSMAWRSVERLDGFRELLSQAWLLKLADYLACEAPGSQAFDECRREMLARPMPWQLAFKAVKDIFEAGNKTGPAALAWGLTAAPGDDGLLRATALQVWKHDGKTPNGTQKMLCLDMGKEGRCPFRLDDTDNAMLATLIECGDVTRLPANDLTPAMAERLCQCENLFLALEPSDGDSGRSTCGRAIPAVWERISLETAPMALTVHDQPDGAVRLGLCNGCDSRPSLESLGDSRYVLRCPTREIQKFAGLLAGLPTKDYVEIPAEAANDRRAFLSSLASRYVLAGEFSGKDADLETVAAGLHPVVRLSTPREGGCEVSLLNRPVEGHPLRLVPGQGTPSLTIVRDERPFLLQRSLGKETEMIDELRRAIPLLNAPPNGAMRWRLGGLEESLRLIGELQEKAAGLGLEVEWDRRPLRVIRRRNWRELGVTGGQSANGWFTLGGDVAVDEGKVLSMSELMAAVAATDGDFIRLDDGTYLELEENLRRRLRTLAALAQSSGKAGEVTLPPAAVSALAGLFDGEAPASFAPALDRLRQAMADCPAVPAGLQAELRSYQREGFVWLRRLADCGFGACLADDMGIGKTLQAIALLLDIADRGPSLVIAPASLGSHWLDELSRFAPDLSGQLFGGGDRQALVSAAGPGDVVVCTYGIATTETELLASRHWNCLVLDEAQAIKNQSARRTRAVKRLPADFRLALTGTPVENNLQELWSLFDFLNPGLLGHEDAFRRRLAADGGTVADLRRAIAPLMLRRRKDEVLAELPPRTEITHEVSLDETERAMYEALRRKALDSFAKGDSGKGRMDILAHLQKLRMFCCHPSLADCIATGRSSKLEELLQLAASLREAGHRALVFSQFVSFLAIIRREFEAAGLAFRYLDGSTPPARRQELVDGFNQGQDDFFLISLKAGGLGLNLTSADFVILLDPWWNPAVESQAADRVYRIGQKKPVTIYRLVCKDTVEQRVLEMHERKRELADEILAGQAAAGLKLEELRSLLESPAESIPPSDKGAE